MGFLIWTEIPAWKTDTEVLTDPGVWQKYGKPQLQSLVHNFRSHPSVVLWSVGNEFNSDSDLGAEYVQRSTQFVRSLDPTRLVSFASDRHRPGQTDNSFAFVDVIAVNEYYGWYYYTMNDVGDMLDRLHSDWPDKPILVAEFGSGSLQDMRNQNPEDSGKDYSIDYQNKFISRHLEQIYAPERRDYVVGSLVWLYNDFPDPHRVGSGHPVQNNYVNSKGLVTQDRTRKPAFDLVKEYFNQLSE
jgi:beta-galactosidase/beta-glucuronidase